MNSANSGKRVEGVEEEDEEEVEGEESVWW